MSVSIAGQPAAKRLPPLMLAGAIVLWGSLGWLDLGHRARAGFETDGNQRVTRVEAGSPAAGAGLKAGDVLTQIDGVAAANAAAVARLPRVAPGEVRTFVFLRGGEEFQRAIVHAGMPRRDLRRAGCAAVVGFCYLLLPLAAWLRRPSQATRVLAMMGAGLSLAFLAGPEMEPFVLRAASAAVVSGLVLCGVAATAHFLLVFPRRWSMLDRPRRARALYGPALLLWMLLAYRLLFTPAGSDLLTFVTSALSAVTVGGYLLFSGFCLLRNYSRTDRALRRALAFNAMTWATVAGLLPVLIARLVAAFSPQSALPGQDFYFVSLALIPLAWARAASRQTAAGEQEGFTGR